MTDKHLGKNRLDQAATLIAGLVLLAILLFLSLLSVFQTNAFGEPELTLYLGDSILLHLANLAVVLLLWKWLRPRLLKLRARWLFCGLMAVVAVAFSALVLAGQVKPSADAAMVLDSAEAYAAGKLDDIDYFKRYPNNIGLMFYFIPFCALGGEKGFLLIQLANVGWLVVIHLCLALLADKLLKSPAATRLTMLLGVAFYPLGLYVIFVYGTLAGLALALLALVALCRYFGGGRLGWGLAAGGLVGLAVIVRNNSVIFLAAMLIYCLLDAFAAKRWKSLALAAALLALGLGLNQGALWLYAGLSGRPAPPQGLPALHWVVIGISETEGYAPGWWGSQFTHDLLEAFNESGYDAAVIEPMLQTKLAERADTFKGHPPYLFYFLYKKAASMWNHPSFQAFWIGNVRETNFDHSAFLTELYRGGLNRFFTGWANLYQSLVLVCAAFFAVLGLKKREPLRLLLAVPFIGGFLFHLLWEAKAQYAVVYFVLLIPYAAAGLDALTTRAFAGLAGLREHMKSKREGKHEEKPMG